MFRFCFCFNAYTTYEKLKIKLNKISLSIFTNETCHIYHFKTKQKNSNFINFILLKTNLEKPKRRKKQQKKEAAKMDSSSRPTAELINIIKDLHYNASSEHTDERDRIIKKVDKQFSDCDERIDKYIRYSSKDLTRLIKVFNEIAKKIEVSRAHVSNSRDQLKQCKVLLQSKRDDVRRLWLDSCEQKFYYENLTKLKQLYTAPENIRLLCNQKSYLEAAQLIADCTKLLDNEYAEIAGLHEVKRNIEDERFKLEAYLHQELTDQLYSTVTRSVLETGAVLPTRELSFKRRFRNTNQANASNYAISSGADGLSANESDSNRLG